MADDSPNRTSLERLKDGRPRFHGCSKIQDYEFISKLGEGTFGEVSKARSKKSSQVVALKKILMHNEKDGFPITALREIKLLKQLNHPNILKLEEMAVERTKDARKKPSMFMVTPYMDHDLSGLLENPAVVFTEPQIKCYMKQLLEGCAYLHENKILHRDMKAANLLINNHGILQIADFGLARPYDEEPPKPGRGGGEATREYTTLVVTRWYRPPELLLQLRKYTTAIDMWGVGCVFGEMFEGKPILTGNSDLNQAQIIFDLVGSPTETNMPGWSHLPGCEGVKEFSPRASTLEKRFKQLSPLALSLLSELLKLDWRQRINAIDALQHPYFHTHPLPLLPHQIPFFEESHELDRRKFREASKIKPPPAPAGGTVGLGAGQGGEWGINGRPNPHIRPSDRIPGGHRRPENGYERRPPQNGNYMPDRSMPRDPPYNADRRPPPRRADDGYPRQTLPYNDNLPPRPPLGVDYRREGSAGAPPYREDRRPPRYDQPRPAGGGGGGGGGGDVDTYIPSYSTAQTHERRPPRRDWDREQSPRRYDRERDRDRDRDRRRD